MAAPTVVVPGLAFGEGPRWHEGRLWLSDMHRHRVLSVDAAGAVTVELQHDTPVSGLGWTPSGELLTVVMDGEVLRGGEPFADLRPSAPHGVNDMISHPGGWSWVGQFGYDRHGGGAPTPAPLLRVDDDGRVTSAADDLLVANGMAVSADGATLFVAESAGGRISAFSVGDDGALSARRTFAPVPPPDGICLDADGCLWVAGVTTGAFVRVAEGGGVLDTVEVEPGRRPIACVLGGDDRRTLYMVTATTKGEAEASIAAMSSRVEQVRVDVAGAGRP